MVDVGILFRGRAQTDGAARQVQSDFATVERSAERSGLQLDANRIKAKDLRTEMRQVASEFARGNGTLDDSTQKYGQLETQLELVEKEYRQIADSSRRAVQPPAGAVESGYKKLVSQLSLVAFAYGAVRLARASYSAIVEGADIALEAKNFNNLALSIDSTADSLLGKLKIATKEMVSDAELYAITNELIQTGLADTEESAVRLASLSSQLGLDLSVLQLTLLNDSEMRLDGLKLSAERIREIQADIEASGFVGDAFDEAVLRGLEENLDKLQDVSGETSGQLKQVVTTLNDLGDAAKLALAEGVAPLIDDLSRLDTTELERFVLNIGELATRADITSALLRSLGVNSLFLERDLRMASNALKALNNELEVAEQRRQVKQAFKEIREEMFLLVGTSFEADFALNAAADGADSLDQKSQRAAIALSLMQDGFRGSYQDWRDAIGNAEYLSSTTGKVADSVDDADRSLKILNDTQGRAANASDHVARVVGSQADSFNELANAVARAADVLSSRFGNFGGGFESNLDDRFGGNRHNLTDDQEAAVKFLEEQDERIQEALDKTADPPSGGGYARRPTTDYNKLAQEIENSAERIIDIEEDAAAATTGTWREHWEKQTEITKARDARLKEINEATAEDVVRINGRMADEIVRIDGRLRQERDRINTAVAQDEKRLTDEIAAAWADLEARRTQALADFERDAASTYDSIRRGVSSDNAPTFEDLFNDYVGDEIADGATEDEIRTITEGFQDIDDAAETDRIDSFADALETIRHSDLGAEEKAAALDELNRQYEAGERANLESFGLTIIDANEFAKRETAARLAEVEQLERDNLAAITALHQEASDAITALEAQAEIDRQVEAQKAADAIEALRTAARLRANSEIERLDEQTAAKIVQIEDRAAQQIEGVLERLEGTFERTFGENYNSAEQVRGKLEEIRDELQNLTDGSYQIVLDIVNGAAGGSAPSAAQPRGGAPSNGPEIEQFYTGGYNREEGLKYLHADEVVLNPRQHKDWASAVGALQRFSPNLGDLPFPVEWGSLAAPQGGGAGSAEFDRSASGAAQERLAQGTSSGDINININVNGAGLNEPQLMRAARDGVYDALRRAGATN